MVGGNGSLANSLMDEHREREQYFFDQATLDYLAGIVSRYSNPCCLCAPTLGAELEKRGVPARTLDIDDRFSGLTGFRRYDIAHPGWLGEEFGLIVCDPPFFNVSLSQLFRAVRLLSRHDYSQPLMVSYLARRSGSLLRTFAPFNLRPTGYFPSYTTVEKVERNRIEFFANVAME
jgi:hypothetical protein